MSDSTTTATPMPAPEQPKSDALRRLEKIERETGAMKARMANCPCAVGEKIREDVAKAESAATTTTAYEGARFTIDTGYTKEYENLLRNQRAAANADEIADEPLYESRSRINMPAWMKTAGKRGAIGTGIISTVAVVAIVVLVLIGKLDVRSDGAITITNTAQGGDANANAAAAARAEAIAENAVTIGGELSEHMQNGMERRLREPEREVVRRAIAALQELEAETKGDEK